MKFKLDCTLVLSKVVEGLKTTEIVEGVKPLLAKGAPEGMGSVLEDITLDGDKLRIKLSSGQYVRPHDAVFRIKNFLAKELGQKYKAGVREIKGDRYAIEFELDHVMTAAPKVPFASKVEVKDKKCTLDRKSVV